MLQVASLRRSVYPLHHDVRRLVPITVDPSSLRHLPWPPKSPPRCRIAPFLAVRPQPAPHHGTSAKQWWTLNTPCISFKWYPSHDLSRSHVQPPHWYVSSPSLPIETSNCICTSGCKHGHTGESSSRRSRRTGLFTLPSRMETANAPIERIGGLDVKYFWERSSLLCQAE